MRPTIGPGVKVLDDVQLLLPVVPSQNVEATAKGSGHAREAPSLHRRQRLPLPAARLQVQALHGVEVLKTVEASAADDVEHAVNHGATGAHTVHVGLEWQHRPSAATEIV